MKNKRALSVLLFLLFDISLISAASIIRATSILEGATIKTYGGIGNDIHILDGNNNGIACEHNNF